MNKNFYKIQAVIIFITLIIHVVIILIIHNLYIIYKNNIIKIKIYVNKYFINIIKNMNIF